jgi:hypothetical protein
MGVAVTVGKAAVRAAADVIDRPEEAGVREGDRSFGR